MRSFVAEELSHAGEGRLIVNSRRNFLRTASSAALGVSLAGTESPARSNARLDAENSATAQTKRLSLNGAWLFRFDSDKAGLANGWYKPEIPADGWDDVVVPHTWQIAQDSTDYFGTAWSAVSWRYRKHGAGASSGLNSRRYFTRRPSG